MAVYTKINVSDLEVWFTQLNLGKVLKIEEITAGIENSNYFVTSEISHPHTKNNQWVCTIFERTPPDNLAFYFTWLNHLHQNLLPVPYPLAANTIKNNPAILLSRLSGEKIITPNKEQVYAVGKTLALIHQNSPEIKIPKQPCNIIWQKNIYDKLKGKIASDDEKIINNYAVKIWNNIEKIDNKCASGAIHADLFCDNLLFFNNEVSGVFDFFFGGKDYYIYDIAVCLNDWCVTTNGKINQELSDNFIKGYESKRQLNNSEKENLPLFLAFAALRFYLSRLADLAFPREGIVNPHDPKHFREIFTERVKKLVW